ncbi:hypothetical protein GGX14DRAFT_367937, partial [Mycena pura]
PAIFFGRSKEVEQVVNLLLYHEPACVAIVGTGGIGKTSIALASIDHPSIQKHFLTQRFFLSCEATSTSDSLAQALLDLFGLLIDSSHPRSPSDTLVLYLQSLTSRCLLCLDNFETPWDSDKDQVELLLARIVAVQHLTLVITSRNSDRPRGIKWSELKPIQPLTLEAAIETWDAISYNHDDFSILLIQAVEGIPLAVTLLAQLAQVDSSEALWASWNSELTKFIKSDGSENRQNSLDLSIQLSIQSPRLRACTGALDFFVVLCMLPQGMPELRISDFEVAFGTDFTGLRSVIRVLKQCSLAYARDGFLCVLSPIRQYTQAHQELSTLLTRNLFLKMTKLYLNLIPADPYNLLHLVKDIDFEIGNITAVLDMCLTEEQVVIEETIHFSVVCRALGSYDTRLLSKSAMVAHKYNPSLEGRCFYEQGVTHGQFGKLCDAEQALQSALVIHKQQANKLGQANDLLELGKIYIMLNQLEDAEKALMSALDFHNDINDTFGQANDLQWLGILHIRVNQLDDAEKSLQSALDLYKQVNARHGEADVLYHLGKLYMRLGQLEDAETTLQSALELDKQVNSKVREANNLKELGVLYMMLNRLDDAEEALQSALNLHRQSDTKLGEANDLDQLGKLYTRLHRLEDAEKVLKSALDLHKQVNHKLGEANTLQQLGELYLLLSWLGNAEKALQSALELHKQANDRLGQAYDLQKLGELYMDHNQLDNAKTTTLKSALDLHIQVNDKLGQANDLHQLGMLYRKLNWLEDAEKALQSACDLHKQLNARLNEANILYELGVLYMELERLDDAENALQPALDLHKKVNSKLGQANDLQQLGVLYMRLSRLEDAEKSLQSAHDLHQQANDRFGRANDLLRLEELHRLQEGQLLPQSQG